MRVGVRVGVCVGVRVEVYKCIFYRCGLEYMQGSWSRSMYVYRCRVRERKERIDLADGRRSFHRQY